MLSEHGLLTYGFYCPVEFLTQPPAGLEAGTGNSTSLPRAKWQQAQPSTFIAVSLNSVPLVAVRALGGMRALDIILCIVPCTITVLAIRRHIPPERELTLRNFPATQVLLCLLILRGPAVQAKCQISSRCALVGWKI